MVSRIENGKPEISDGLGPDKSDGLGPDKSDGLGRINPMA
jgi:hypothetical protein